MRRTNDTSARPPRRRLVRRARLLACVAVVIGAMGLVARPAAADERSLDDGDITLAVETDLIVDEGVSAHAIDVETVDGIVTLSGTVDNLLAKERATRLAETVKGVRAVVNRIEMRGLPVRSDAELADDVKEALLADPAADAYELDVSADTGRITLRGSVESHAEKRLATLVAKGVRGVRAVDSQIEIEPVESRLDAEIESEIERRLEMDVWVDADLLTVDVDDGRVTLTGSVGNAAERARARADAWVKGVGWVDDEGVEVQWWVDRKGERDPYTLHGDDEIAAAVRDALRHDPRVWSFNPEVEVTNGTVTLTGAVDNLRAKHAAAEDAQNTVGVWRVRNHLRVRPDPERSDERIDVGIEAALGRDPFVSRHEIDVHVSNAKAHLYGAVDSAFERERAARVARGIDGVVEVFNGVQVTEHRDLEPDWLIAQDVRDGLFWNPWVDASAVSVSVTGGVVTLEGEVATWAAMTEAVREAYDAGAEQVINDLELRGAPSYIESLL